MDKILIEVNCPATSKKYDFWVSKQLKVGKAVEKILQEIRSYEKNELLFGEEEDTLLYLYRTRQVPSYQVTVEQAGVRSGDRLVVI